MGKRQSYKVKGDVVRTLRDLRFMSQEDLAKESGVSESTIRRMEAGGMSSHRGNVKKIAAALDVTPGEIVEFDDPELVSRLRGLAVA